MRGVTVLPRSERMGNVEVEVVLGQIDEALEDWSVGPDAMRCGAPEDAQPSWRSVPITTFPGRTNPLVMRPGTVIHLRAFGSDGTRLRVVGEPVWDDVQMTVSYAIESFSQT